MTNLNKNMFELKHFKLIWNPSKEFDCGDFLDREILGSRSFLRSNNRAFEPPNHILPENHHVPRKITVAVGRLHYLFENGLILGDMDLFPWCARSHIKEKQVQTFSAYEAVKLLVSANNVYPKPFRRAIEEPSLKNPFLYLDGAMEHPQAIRNRMQQIRMLLEKLWCLLLKATGILKDGDVLWQWQSVRDCYSINWDVGSFKTFLDNEHVFDDIPVYNVIECAGETTEPRQWKRPPTLLAIFDGFHIFSIGRYYQVHFFGDIWTPQLMSAMKKNGWLGYVGNHTTQLCGDYNKPLYVRRIPIEQSWFNGMWAKDLVANFAHFWGLFCSSSQVWTLWWWRNQTMSSPYES